MSTPFATPTPTFHKTPYPAISPTLPSLSVAGKTIIITGGGSGIGRALVLAFASAGASRICILGRRLSALHETRSIAERQFPNLIVERYSADVTDASAVREVAAQIGKWDVLCLNAGYLADLKGMGECDVEDWWRGFEVNVKGPFVCLQAFMPNRGREGRPVVIETNAASIQAPAVFMPGWSSYSSSKAAAVKVMEFAAGEKEWADTHFVSFHPGIVDTDITKKVFGGKQDEAEAKAKGQDLDDSESFRLRISGVELDKLGRERWDLGEC